MKLFDAEQIKAWDEFTIKNEPISSINLMERAAKCCYSWIMNHYVDFKHFDIFCGNGNNGGDGLAIARLLYQSNKEVTVYLLPSKNRSENWLVNYERVLQSGIRIIELETAETIYSLPTNHIAIDALFGTGLNKPLQGIATSLVEYLNHSAATIISIDLPSGMYTNRSSIGNAVINATHTLSFQNLKHCCMFEENETYLGVITLLDIGLDKKFEEDTECKIFTIEKSLVSSIYKPRKKFTHKYNFGHALLIAGSQNMPGAAILCAKACYRSGAGLVSVWNDSKNSAALQIAVPEAISSNELNIEKLLYKKTAIAIGPGLQINEANEVLLKNILQNSKSPVVIDASALHLLKKNMQFLPAACPVILTPHSGEFEQIFGSTTNNFERMELASIKAAQLNCYIILKGANSMLVCPDGEILFNTTGNSGMATAGSGDVLTGIITGLLAQGYTPKHACIMGMYLHGLAGDLAAQKFGKEALMASDITAFTGAAFLQINAH